MSGGFNLAIVGAGGIARTHANAGAGINGLQVAAVCDANEQAAREFAGKFGGTAFGSLQAMLSAMDSGKLTVDGVLVCTPPTVRVEVVEACVARRIACLIEKPLASSGEDARRVAEAAGSRSIVAVAYCHRFVPAMLEMKRLIGEGLIGRPTRFENVFAFHYPPMAGRWMSDPEASGGGALIDTGSHSIDLFRFLIGDGQLAGVLVDHAWKDRGESSATMLVRSTGPRNAGCAGVILAGWMEPARFQVSVIGDAGSLSYDYDRPLELVHRPGDGAPRILAVETHEVRFARQLEAFTQAVRGEPGAASRLASVDDGLAASLLIADAYESVMSVRR